jgi:tryptophan-rich sensory protein
MTVQSIKPKTPSGLRSALVSVAIAVTVGAVGGLATASSIPTWYAALRKPAFNPPNAVFGPAWTALYVLMALAAWRVWRARPSSGVSAAGARRAALVLYAVQLILNLGWMLIFFGLRRPGAAMAEVLALLLAVIACAGAFWRVDRIAGLMMAPYAAWVTFASALNLAIWRLN